MYITPWLRSIKTLKQGRKSPSAALRRRARSLHAVEALSTQIERMEDRTLLAAATFLPDQHIVRIEDVGGLDNDLTTPFLHDKIGLDIRFDTTPTHGAGIYLLIQDLVNGMTTNDPAFFQADAKTLLIPLEWVHCLNIHTGEGNDHVAADNDFTYSPGSSFFIKIKMHGGPGNDSLNGGLADDHFVGGEGDDIAFGDGGHDKLFGGFDEPGAGTDKTGADTLVGGDGNDFIDGGAGNDLLDGGDRSAAANVVRDGTISDTAGKIDDGDDTLAGGAGNDLLIGGTGKNVLSGGAGRDTIEATDYNPVFVFPDKAERVIAIAFTRGSNPGIPDELSIDGTAVVDLLAGNPGGFFDSDRDKVPDGFPMAPLDPDPTAEPWDVVRTFSRFEEIEVAHITRVLDTTLAPRGMLSPNLLTVSAGDAKDGIASFDEVGMIFVDAGDGADTITTGPNADTIYGGNGNDVLNGVAGNDLINGDYALSKGPQGGTFHVIQYPPPYNKPPIAGPILVPENGAGFGKDKIFGGEGQDTLEGGLGNDSIFGQGGRDYLYAFQHDGDRSGQMDPSKGALINVDVDPTDKLLINPPEAAFVPRVFPMFNPDSNGAIDKQDWPGAPLTPQAVGLTGKDSGRNLMDGGEAADVVFGGELRDTLFGGPGGRSEYVDPRLSEITTGVDQKTQYHLRDYDLIYGGLEVVYGLTDPATKNTIGTRVGVPMPTMVDKEGDLVGDFHFANLRPTEEDGGAGADLIFGTEFPDTIHAGGGHDTVVGGAEPSPGDFIEGGVGNDLLIGDLDLFAATVPAFGGDDTINGNAGDDTILGGAGNDCLRGHAGNDSISGGKGNDAISGNQGDDWLFGNEGDDDLTGGSQNDYLDGGDGKDTLHGGTGNDTLTGPADDSDDDNLDGGSGTDMLFHKGPGDFTLTPTMLTNNATKETDSLTSLELAFATNAGGASLDWDGSAFTGAQTLIGGDGADTLMGGKGNDLIIGGTDPGGKFGNDSLVGNGGNDLIFAGYAAFVVEDDSEVPGGPMAHVEPEIFLNPESELKLSQIDITSVDEVIAYDGFQARLVGDPYAGMYVGPKTAGREKVDMLFASRSGVFGANGNYRFTAGDLHILVLDPDSSMSPLVETIVKIEGGFRITPDTFDPLTGKVIPGVKLTGIMVTDVDPSDGKLDFDKTATDTVSGGDGNDVLIGSAGKDSMSGGNGNDLLVGADDADKLSGNVMNDTLYGLDGDDTIEGNDDDDVLNGGEGADKLVGDKGNDCLTGGPGADTFSGGTGIDTLFEAFNIHAKAVYDGTVNGTLAATTDGFGFAKDVIVGKMTDVVENLFLIGGDDDNDLDASGWTVDAKDADPLAGNVTLVGLAGDDTLTGTNTGTNALDGGADDDQITGGDLADTIDGGPGQDTIDAKSGNDIVLAGSGHDSVLAGDGKDTVYGDLGNDTIFGGPGNDVLLGGPGGDNLFGEAGDDFLYGDGRFLLVIPDCPFEPNFNAPDLKDLLDGGAGDDGLSGGDGNDILIGGPDTGPLSDDVNPALDPNLAAGGKFVGNDTLVGGRGDDTLLGGQGNDILIGQSGKDTVDGEAGADSIQPNDGSDLIVPGAGDQIFGKDFTEGANTFLKSILVDKPLSADLFTLDGDGRLDWLDAI